MNDIKRMLINMGTTYFLEDEVSLNYCFVYNILYVTFFYKKKFV